MKRVQLVERDPDTGRIIKNESYYYDALRAHILGRNEDYFTHLLWGRIRRNVVDRILVTFMQMTDEDNMGKSR